MTESSPFKIKFYDEKIRVNVNEGDEYCSSFLPEDIHFLGLEKGSYVDVEKVNPVDGPVFLKAVKVPEDEADSRIHYKITKYGSRHYLTIPKTWQDELIQEPKKEHLVVEINLVEKPSHIRVYGMQDYYNHRKNELEKQGYSPKRGDPIILPLTTLIWAKTAGKLTRKQPENIPSEPENRSKALREGFGKDIDDENDSANE